MRRSCLLGSDEVPQEPRFEPLPPIKRNNRKTNPENDKLKEDKDKSKHQENHRSRHNKHKKQRTQIDLKK